MEDTKPRGQEDRPTSQDQDEQIRGWKQDIGKYKSLSNRRKKKITRVTRLASILVTNPMALSDQTFHVCESASSSIHEEVGGRRR